MTTSDMFEYTPKLSFPKVASLDLGEDQSQWAKLILGELYRTVPEAGQYAPKVSFLRMDEEQGFAMGLVTLDGGTNSAVAAASQAVTPNTAHVVVIIRHHVMCPLDVMVVNGKLLPFNADRLREALFRPQPFDLLTDDWGDTSLLSMLQLPGRGDISPNSGFSTNAGADATTIFGPGMKTGADYEMLKEIQSTLLKADLQAMSDKIAADPALLHAMKENASFFGGLRVISEAEKVASADPLSVTQIGNPDVVQIAYRPVLDAYVVKVATRRAYNPVAIEMDRGAAIKFAGEEVIKKVDTEGAVTIAAPTVESTDVQLASNASKWVVVDESGIYKVQTTEGKELTGWVLPNLIDFDGVRVPMAVFSNGSAAAVQDSIAGARVATGVDMPSAQPKGTGLFYMAGPMGIDATVPVQIAGSEASVEGHTTYVVRTFTGGEHRVRLVPGLKALKVMQGDAFVPDTVKFLPLEDEQNVSLLSDPSGLSKTAAVLMAPSIRIFAPAESDMCQVAVSGMPKLAAGVPAEMPIDGAIFLLCAAGLSPVEAVQKIAHARYSPVVVRGLEDVRLASDLVDEAQTKVAAASRQVLSLRRDLTKEAAALPDVHTVDAVLSLSLLNSENLRSYVEKLPYLEKALTMLCHLLLSSRVGLQEVPEYATARCIRGLDEVCRGLRALGLRNFSETDAPN